MGPHEKRPEDEGCAYEEVVSGRMEQASADVLAGRGARPGPLEHVWPEPVVRKPHNGVLKRLENVPRHDKKPLPPCRHSVGQDGTSLRTGGTQL